MVDATNSRPNPNKLMPDGTPRTEYELVVAARPCACLVCRGEGDANEQCKFKILRGTRSVWVTQELASDVKKRTPITCTSEQMARVRVLLNLEEN